MNFWMRLTGALVGIGLAVSIWFLTGCGPTPYATCSAAQQNASRCAEQGEAVEFCDGHHWLPAHDCAKLWDSEGNEIAQQCVDGDGKAVCQ